MSEDLQKKIFAQNLLKYISLSGKSQKEIADTIKVSPQTFNTWCQGIALPRMGKVQLLADYFHISKSDLLELQQESTKKNPGIHFINSEGQEQTFDTNSIMYSIIEAVSQMPPVQQEMVNNMVGGGKHKNKIIYIENPQNRKPEPLLNAAHARTDIEFTAADLKHDDDIMDDENF